MSNSDAHKEYGLSKIAPHERSYGFVDTVWLWFGSGVNTGSWFFGGMAAALGMMFVLQYSVLWLPLMMIPWAAVAYIGYRYGASTAVVARPSLGTKGSRLTGIAQFLVLIGWPSVNSFIAAISLSHVFGAAFDWPVFGQPGSTGPMVLGILLTAVAQGVIAFLGHEAIRYLERIAGFLLLVLGGWVTYIVLSKWNLEQIMAFQVQNPTHSVAFFIDLAFGFSWTWAQVADFSRFAKTGRAATVGSWLGLNIGQGWFMLIGAIGTIGVALQTGSIDPNNSDPSSTLATLGLGMVSFLVLIFATVSTNVSVLYGSGMGLLSAFKGLTPKKALAIIVVLQLALCFVPMAFDSFLHYFETFLGVIGGLFIPLWTIILMDYFGVRGKRLSDADLFAEAGGAYYGSTGWNAAGITSLVLGFAVYFVLAHVFKDVAAQTTASIPAILVSGLAYALLVKKPAVALSASFERGA
ncbi:NCS1 nucleoside transporter family [Geopseudomonas sagittaria]|uniref:NCS1 nucleoside transporter family n=1 Tax=Geopseudomonas sagittaria TaxID=1135990 RepID=A0A1I5P842_9GAMM|nr:cytosine permease [Pseudomonas sagittaria]MCM2330303.1 cytosine permease [Pseudomonas sagittaria]SFP29636.1 NCS1 nucleoside transporter family [Pseudomonas sagittaria]